MAKWGEGDERWIVQEREDGVNVNGWHWQEKNYMGWGRERLSDLLTAVTFDLPNDEGSASVIEISKFEGDAAVSIRKGNKKFAVFDLNITLKWEGTCEGFEGDGIVKGEIKIAEFASTNDEDEYEFKVNASDGDADAKKKMKQKIKSVVAEAFMPHLNTFAKELAEM